MPESRVGFIGLGRMGAAMARTLLGAGIPLTVYNRTPARTDALQDAGAQVAPSPAAAAAGAAVVITMVSDADAVRKVLLGDHGVFAGAPDGAVVCEMSTIGPGPVRELAAAAETAGVALLDAPVSGSVALAASGALVTVVGGDADAFARARSVLAAMTKEQLYLGPSGAGAAMKPLALNGMIAVTSQAVAEALVLAQAAGVDGPDAYDAIARSAVGSPFIDYKRDAYLDPAGTPPAFSLALMAKDLQLQAALAAQHGLCTTGVRDAAVLVDAARAVAGDEADIARVVDVLRAGAHGGSVTPEADRLGPRRRNPQ